MSRDVPLRTPCSTNSRNSSSHFWPTSTTLLSLVISPRLIFRSALAAATGAGRRDRQDHARMDSLLQSRVPCPGRPRRVPRLLQPLSPRGAVEPGGLAGRRHRPVGRGIPGDAGLEPPLPGAVIWRVCADLSGGRTMVVPLRGGRAPGRRAGGLCEETALRE